MTPGLEQALTVIGSAIGGGLALGAALFAKAKWRGRNGDDKPRVPAPPTVCPVDAGSGLGDLKTVGNKQLEVMHAIETRLIEIRYQLESQGKDITQVQTTVVALHGRLDKAINGRGRG